MPTKPPALSTRSQVAAAQPPKPAPVSQLKQPTRQSKRATKKAVAKHQANAVMCMRDLEQQINQALAVMDKDTGKMLKYKQLLRHPKYQQPWSKSSANKFGHLAQGVGGGIKKPTNTIRFIREQDVPKSRKKDVTYGSFVCSVRPEKTDEPNRTRFTVGGDKINYPGEVATPTADMLVTKMLFNSVVSTAGARFMTMDISNFYLMTPLLRPEYLKIKLSDIPTEIIAEYNLKAICTNKGHVFIEVTKGMYGLPQAGLLANELLEKQLNKHGYQQSKLVPGLWKHDTRPPSPSRW